MSGSFDHEREDKLISIELRTRRVQVREVQMYRFDVVLPEFGMTDSEVYDFISDYVSNEDLGAPGAEESEFDILTGDDI